MGMSQVVPETPSPELKQQQQQQQQHQQVGRRRTRLSVAATTAAASMEAAAAGSGAAGGGGVHHLSSPVRQGKRAKQAQGSGGGGGGGAGSSYAKGSMGFPCDNDAVARAVQSFARLFALTVWCMCVDVVRTVGHCLHLHCTFSQTL